MISYRTTVLLGQGDQGILRQLSSCLDREGFRILTAGNGHDALHTALARHPDLIILDVLLSKFDGLDVCRQLRSSNHMRTVPIIMLTTPAREWEVVKALEIGADDYVRKPVNAKILMARINSLFGRIGRTGTRGGESRYNYGSISVNLLRHEVMMDGREVVLTAKEFGLLEHLIRNPGKVLTRDFLLNAIWGYNYYGTTRTVDVHIRRIKQKLPCLSTAIRSIKCFGYELRAQFEVDGTTLPVPDGPTR
ncbi:DNA-binding response regulator in two-component regulatory system with PhoR [Nitrospira sp. KM1]|uniref:response regulator transcription factor n=1 Tax=Nitrospira sp. KM1 TaxID=1936990 RepID=UPI0013A769D1|nr:response regulator transcription factor [Nitrospira sp. KM1]BCA57099.1 DNA-binding response regulator in two-component regulatory system with PhoR [Nitrospira sp. KM1]